MSSSGLTVVGGAGGVQARLDQLDGLELRIHSTATEVGSLAVEAVAIGQNPALVVTAAFDPVGGATAGGTLAAAVTALAATASRVEVLARAVGVAALAYRLSDEDVASVLAAAWHDAPTPLAAAVLAVGGLAAGGWVTGRVGARVVLDAPVAAAAFAHGVDPAAVAAVVGKRVGADLAADGQVTLEWLVRHPDVAREVLATLPMAAEPILPDDPQPGHVASGAAGFSSLLLAAGRPLGLFVDGRVAVTDVSRSIKAGPTGVHGLLGRLAHLTSPRGTLVGYTPNQAGVLVDRVTPAAGGTNRWIVYLPPTSDWGVTGGRYPSDLTSNVAMVSKQGARSGRDPDAVRQAVAAMRQAGVQPGQPVMLVGFSQGGITAASLASDPEIRAEFQVEAVLTAGSPISEFDLPDDVAVLSIENDADLIPELDGATNPDLPHWTTVNADVLDEQAGDSLTRERVGGGEPFAGHYLDGYLRTAEQVDVSTDDSVQTWRRAAGPFLTGTQVETTEVTVERIP